MSSSRLYLAITALCAACIQSPLALPVDEKSCDPCDPACSAAKYGTPGMAAEMGTMYSVSGSAAFAAHAFVPVIEHMRKVVGIPEPAERKKKNLSQWALVTEPALCRGVLAEVIPFFDVVITFDVLPSGNRNPLDEEEVNGLTLQSRRLRSIKNIFGQAEEEERDNGKLRHWVKAFKVNALANSPFKHTVYMDVDTVPCNPDFVKILVDMYGEADMAIGPNTKEVMTIPHDHLSHYEGNSHNSALVLLNMASENTMRLLERYQHHFFTASKMQTLDQPSLGAAMTDMVRSGSFYHECIDKHVMCRRHITGGSHTRCMSGCLMVHKVTEKATVADHGH